MDATQQIEDSFFGEEDDSDDEHELGEGKKQTEPLAVLKVFKNSHIPETEVPLYQGENVLGRDSASCSVPLQARSVSSRHAVISISVFDADDRRAHSEATEALLWDLGSLNGTRKGRLKLTPHVRYALTEGDGVVLADLPCQYVSLKNTERNTKTSTADVGREKAKGSTSTGSSSEEGRTGKGVENGRKKCALPPVPVWTDEAKSLQSIQMTPKKPETTLVPESDSDSDGEKHGRRERRRIVVSDSASSDLSSPTCSTFLTPANKIIPESEDESSITPSPALKGRFLKTGNDTEVSSDSSKPDPLHLDIDSDTDVEDEEVEMTKATPGFETAVRAQVDAVNPADLHMDSDTDVEEEAMEKARSDPEASAAPSKQDSVNPAALSMDSDTDVEENEPVETDTAPLSGPKAALDEKKEPVGSAPFHLESDTDVDDEDVPPIQDSRPPTSHVAELNMNSDTDVEDDEDTTKAIEPPSGTEADSKDLGKTAKSLDGVNVPDAKMLRHQSDSDTDVEDDITEIRTPTVANVTGSSRTRSEIQTADERGTDARQDSPLQVQPVLDEVRLDSDTDVEEDEEKVEENERKCAEAAVQIVHSSTPRSAGLSEEEMETQAFLSPPQLFKRPVLPSLLHPSVSPGGVSHTDDDFAVAETQSFVCDAAQADATLDETPQFLGGPESRRSGGASSSQLGFSDSSHQLAEAREPAEEDWQLQATQLYAMKNSEGNTKAGKSLDLDATQAYADVPGQEEEDDGGKEEEEEETQPLAAPGHSSIHIAETQLSKHRAQNEDNSDHDANKEVVASEPERKAEEDINAQMQVDSHLYSADTLLIVRSPRQEEQTTQPYAFLMAQIQKEQEETEKEEHENKDQEVQETDEEERARDAVNESVGQENDAEKRKENDGTVTEKKNEVTSDGPEEEKKERDENRVENDDKVDEARTHPAEADAIVETLAACEEEEQEEEQRNEPSSSRGTPPAEVESTQRLEPDHAHVAIAETLPMCDEDEGQEEDENKPKSSRRPGRGRRAAKVEPVESDKVTSVTVAETQPMCEEDKEEQEEEQQSEAISTKRSSMRRRNAKAKPAKPVESRVAILETLPMCEEEEEREEMPQSEAKSGRKSGRGRLTSKVEPTQPLDPDSSAETMKMDGQEEEQDCRRSLRGKETATAASGKGKGRGRATAEKEKRGKRVTVVQELDSEEEVDQGNKGRGRKRTRQKSKDDAEARLELVEADHEEIEHLKTQEKEEESERLQRGKKEEEDRLERERKEGEEREERELERARTESEKKEREEKEMESLERKKQPEKERREQEEKDRVEHERIDGENKEKEEKEMRERQALEQTLEKERKKQEEMDRLAREKKDREEEEQLEKETREEKEKQEKEMEQKEKEKESKDNKEGVGKEKRPAPGKRKAGLERKGGKSKKEEDQGLEEGTKERLDSEQELSELQKQECEEGSSKKQEDEQAESEAKPRRGRRAARKSVAPPAGVEDEGGPAKRTRSRSNSSNSVCSEQSTQDSLTEGRRRGGRRKAVEEVNETGRPSGRRRTTTAPSTEKEDVKQAAHSRSNSRSSDGSSSSVATQNRGRGRNGRKSVKAEEPEEGEQSAPVWRGRGRGRGRGGKCPGSNDVKAEAAGEPEKEEAEVMADAEDSVMSQSSSRGHKRGADVSMLIAETPQTPKTPRRSLAGQTPKVLFTGVVDEDGEKVVVRLGGGLAKGVGDMTHLVTDKVRRTVKFLCAVARGVPIVTPDWLSKCGKAGSFLSPNGFLVKDVEQEKRFNFSLQEALRVANSQPLLQGYEIHVTPSVKPEPSQMKEIITCSGARFLPKMPSARKAQTVVVVSCEEDRALCERARSLSFPVVSAEFLLTGILQQKADVQTHALSLSPAAAAPKPAARARRK